MLLQTATWEHPAVEEPVAYFTPFGMRSGPNDSLYDPAVFWRPNRACVTAMVMSAGFENADIGSTGPKVSLVLSAQSPTQKAGYPPIARKTPSTGPLSGDVAQANRGISA